MSLVVEVLGTSARDLYFDTELLRCYAYGRVFTRPLARRAVSDVALKRGEESTASAATHAVVA